MGEDQVKEDLIAKEAVRIRDSLVDRHMSMDESTYKLAPRIQIPYTTLQHILKKESGLSLEHFIKICRGLNLNPAEYFLEDDVTAVTPDERKLLDSYRLTSDPSLRELILRHAESVSGVKRSKKSE